MKNRLPLGVSGVLSEAGFFSVPNHFCVSKTHKRLAEEVFNEVFRFILCDRASRQCSRPQTIIDAAVNAEQAGVENELP